MAKRPLLDAPQVEVRSRDDLRDWLAANHRQARGVWLVTYKKSEGDLYLAIPDIVRECLAFGWIDSLTRSKDDRRRMLYISPRKPGSNWSRVNKDHIAALEAEGRMTPAGRALVDQAKEDGTWTALDDVENLVIPPDLQAAFDDRPGSDANWHAFPRSVKRGALEILLNAKRTETRARKLAEIADCAARGDRPFQWRK